MRVGRVVWVAASLAAVSVFTACGSTVTEVSGGTTSTTGGATTTTGAGGAGTTSTVTTTTTTNTNTTSTSTSTSTTNTGAGGATGDVCQQACDKIKGECGVDACAQLPGGQLPCPDYSCVAQCLMDTSCMELFACYQGGPAGKLPACLEACGSPISCKGGGAGGAGAGGGGNAGQACGGCVAKSCWQEALACNQDKSCKPYAGCIQGCAQAPDLIACVDKCGVDHPGASGAQGDLYACTCNSCSDCSALQICQGGAGGAGAGGAGAGGAAPDAGL